MVSTTDFWSAGGSNPGPDKNFYDFFYQKKTRHEEIYEDQSLSVLPE